MMLLKGISNTERTESIAAGVEKAYLVDSFDPEKHDLPKLRREVAAAIAKNRGMSGSEQKAMGAMESIIDL